MVMKCFVEGASVTEAMIAFHKKCSEIEAVDGKVGFVSIATGAKAAAHSDGFSCQANTHENMLKINILFDVAEGKAPEWAKLHMPVIFHDGREE